MKIVVPYTQLHPDTVAAVWDAFEPGDEIVWADVTGSDKAYFQILNEHWRQGQTFVNLEHDKVPAPGALRELHDCESPWCSYPHFAAQGPWVAELPHARLYQIRCGCDGEVPGPSGTSRPT